MKSVSKAALDFESASLSLHTHPSLSAGHAPYPEARLLFLLARLEIDHDTGTRIERLLAQKIDWQLFKRLVERHRLVPLVARHLRDLYDGIAPVEITEYWLAISRSIALRNVILANELVRILELCRSRGIQAIPYKGPMLADWIYGDLCLRTICDL